MEKLKKEKFLQNHKDFESLPLDEQGERFSDAYWEDLKEQAKQEVSSNFHRVAYRVKYNLPPTDPRYLDLTDEEIIYDLLISAEFESKKNKLSDDPEDRREIFESDQQDKDIMERMETEEDFDISSVVPGRWEKV